MSIQFLDTFWRQKIEYGHCVINFDAFINYNLLI